MQFDSIIKSPIVSEKSNIQTEKENKYSFKVNRTATKGAVKAAIEKIYNIKVIDVNIMPVAIKSKRSLVGKRLTFQTKKIKKAVIKLDSKNSIDLFSGGNK